MFPNLPRGKRLQAEKASLIIIDPSYQYDKKFSMIMRIYMDTWACENNFGFSPQKADESTITN